MEFDATVVQRKLEAAGFEPRLACGLTAVLEPHVVPSLQRGWVTREHMEARVAEAVAETKAKMLEQFAELHALHARTDLAIRDNMQI